MSNTILCLTRGGGESYPNQDRAIQIAKERQAQLIFLHISDIRFLGMTASPMVVDIQGEMEEMGEFMLAMAQERAEKEGVKAKTMVRSGIFREVLRRVIKEYPIDTVILGSSRPTTGYTTTEFVAGLSALLAKETGVEFIILDQGETIATFNP